MTTVAIVGVLLAAAMVSLLLRGQRPELGMAVAVLASVMVLRELVSRISPLLSTAETLFEQLPLSWEYGSILIKGLGVCLLTQTAADSCRDAGETALAGKAELTGKITLLALSVPMFEKVANIAATMISGEGFG